MDNDHNTSEAQPYPASGGRSSQSPPYPGLIALLAAAEYIDKKRYISDPSLRNVNNPLLGRDRDLPEDNDSENPEDNDSENSEDNDSKNPEDNDSEDSEDNGSEDSEDMNLGPTIGPRARRADVGGLEDDRLGEGMEVDHSADSDGSDIPTSPDSPAAPAAPDAPAVPAAQAAPATPAAVGYDDIAAFDPENATMAHLRLFGAHHGVSFPRKFNKVMIVGRIKEFIAGKPVTMRRRRRGDGGHGGGDGSV